MACRIGWLGVPNHAGTFATENWSLPWVRLGLRPPPEAPVDAARAAAMAAGLTDFYRDAWGNGEADGPLEAALMRATERARIVVGRVARGSEPDAAAITELARLTREVREVARRVRER